MRSEAGVSKAYVIVTLMICMSFTGCIELDDSADDKSSSSLEEAFNDFIDSINTKNWGKYCSYILYTVEDNEIILANNTELFHLEIITRPLQICLIGKTSIEKIALPGIGLCPTTLSNCSIKAFL